MRLESLALKLQALDLFVLDQQLLPFEEKWIEIESPEHMIEVIQKLKVRGAPLIGVAAALSLAVWSQKNNPTSQEFLQTVKALRNARPTAVNLMNAIDRVLAKTKQGVDLQVCYSEACDIFAEDVQLCEDMAKAAAGQIQDGDRILTHCNSGALATAGRGTALGAITYAHEQKKNIHVYVDETRPLLQGGRLTAWELEKAKIPYTLICDNMAGFLMSQGKIDKIFVGTDRVAANGDFANKVGTYSLAVLARHHKVPMYVVAPSTTLDLKCESGKNIPIEERAATEIHGVEGSFGAVRWAPIQAQVYNPSFDVTPVDLITGIIVDGTYLSQHELKAGALRSL